MMNRRIIQFYGVFWLLGVAFLWWPFALVRTILQHRPAARRLPIALMVIAGCLMASLTIAVVVGAEPARLVAASANLAVWITLCFVVARRWAREDADDVIRGIVDLALFQGVMVVLGRLVYPALAGMTLPLARLLPESLATEPNIAAFSTVQLAQPGYYGGFVVRAGGIFGNPTWAGGFAALAILVVILSRRSLGPWMGRPAVRATVIVLSALTVYWSYSRASTIALAVGVLAVLAVKARGVVHPRLWLASVLITTAAAIAVVPILPLNRWFSQANQPRQGSLTARTDIYSATLSDVAQAPSPLVGSGIKHRAAGLVASEGTHSTYLGLAYRGGLLAAASFVVLLLILGYRGLTAGAPLTTALACFLAVWSLTEDVDAGNLVALAVVVAYGFVTEDESPVVTPTPTSQAAR